jgi:hypothetical protein
MIENDLVSVILNETKKFGDIKKSIDELYVKYHRITSIDGKPKNNSINHGVALPFGETLSTPLAAGCIFDYVRTTKFLRGIKKGIDKFLTQYPDEAVNILYAGSGPFATLISPLLPLYDKNYIKVDVIEYHQESIDHLNEIISQLKLTEYFGDIFQGDAAEYKNEANKKYDIIIAECMRHALIIEGQVGITLNLSKYLSNEGVMIPNKIKVNTLLGNVSYEISTVDSRIRSYFFNLRRKNAIKRRINLGEIICLDKNSHKEFKYLDDSRMRIEGKIIEIPKRIGKMVDIIYETKIEITDGVILDEQDESGLTRPFYEKDFPVAKPGMKIRFDYQMGPNPRFDPIIID